MRGSGSFSSTGSHRVPRAPRDPRSPWESGMCVSEGGWGGPCRPGSVLASLPHCRLPQAHWAAPALPGASLSHGLPWGTRVTPGRMPERNDREHWAQGCFPESARPSWEICTLLSRHEVRWRCGWGPSGLCDPRQGHPSPHLVNSFLSPLVTAGRQRREGPRGVPRPQGRPCK